MLMGKLTQSQACFSLSTLARHLCSGPWFLTRCFCCVVELFMTVTKDPSYVCDVVVVTPFYLGWPHSYHTVHLSSYHTVLDMNQTVRLG